MPQNKDPKRVEKHARMSEKVQVMGVFVVKTPGKRGKGGVKVQSGPRNDRPPTQIISAAFLEV